MRTAACIVALLSVASCRPGGGGKTQLTLAGARVELTLPAGWSQVPDQSNTAAGMVAFALDRIAPGEPGQDPSAFLDASPAGAAMPASLADATSIALHDDDCANPAACFVRQSEGSPDAGYLVSIKTPRALRVVSWRAGPGGRAVRCGAEVSALAALRMHPRTWLDDPGEVLRAGALIEGLCRSVKVTG